MFISHLYSLLSNKEEVTDPRTLRPIAVKAWLSKADDHCAAYAAFLYDGALN